MKSGLLIIAITLVAIVIIGCDEAAMFNDLIIDASTEEAKKEKESPPPDSPPDSPDSPDLVIGDESGPPGPKEVTITVELPYPEDANFNRGVSGVTVTCLLNGSEDQVGITDHLGQVTLIGTLPMTIRAEKPGYVSVERQVTTDDSTVVTIGHEFPSEVERSVSQLGLEKAVAAGEILLIWGDDKYIPWLAKRVGNDDIGGIYACPNIIIRKYEDRNFMLRVLIHELMHARQGLLSTKPPCDAPLFWVQSEDGEEWIAAMEKDLEIGSVPGIDGEPWASSPWENQAELYSHWFFGPETKRLGEEWDQVAELEKLYRLAKYRCQYFEDNFGPPPPRR